MHIMIILGNRLNDDGTMSTIMEKRLKLALELTKKTKVDYIVVSGGIANEKTTLSEADVMADFLIKNDIEEHRIIKENKSLSTFQNALYSIPIALHYNPETISVVTSLDHYMYSYNIVKMFSELLSDENIILLFYTNSNL